MLRFLAIAFAVSMMFVGQSSDARCRCYRARYLKTCCVLNYISTQLPDTVNQLGKAKAEDSSFGIPSSLSGHLSEERERYVPKLPKGYSRETTKVLGIQID